MPDQTVVSEAMEQPKSAASDGLSVTQHSLPDLIKAEQYKASKTAASQPHRGIRFTKLVPPGSIGD